MLLQNITDALDVVITYTYENEGQPDERVKTITYTSATIGTAVATYTYDPATNALKEIAWSVTLNSPDTGNY